MGACRSRITAAAKPSLRKGPASIDFGQKTTQTSERAAGRQNSVKRKALVGMPAIKEKLERMMSWQRSQNGEAPSHNEVDEQPLRAELFSVDQLERHAKAIAASHQLTTRRAPDKLIRRLDENERVLVQTHDLVTAAVKRNRRIAPAAEWLLDNFYLIEEQIRTARRHLPQSYSRELPRLANGPAANYPRAYGIALELIAHVDGRVDAISLDRFIASYQTITPLRLGELWAIPIMLRLALIENLRRVAARVAASRRARNLANDWAERMMRVVEQNPTNLILVLADMARANPLLSGSFLAELTQHLRQSPHLTFANTWLEHRLSEQGLTIEQLVVADGQAQAADQVSMGNSIAGLRFLSSNDWRNFVENHSLVEQVLREDPAGLYPHTDFMTRDRCRHGVEEIARRSPRSESDVARKATELARAAAVYKPDDRTAHVGYYLIDRGRPILERSSEMRSSLWLAATRLGRRQPLFFYLFGVLLVTMIATGIFLEWSSGRGGNALSLTLLAMLASICATNLGVGVVNWLATLLVRPRPLPRMDFSDGIPPLRSTPMGGPVWHSCNHRACTTDLLTAGSLRRFPNTFWLAA